MSRQRISVLVVGSAVALVAVAGIIFDHSISARLGSLALLGVVAAGLFVQHWALLAAWARSNREHADTAALLGRLDAAAATSGGWLYVLDLNNRFTYSSEASMDCIGYAAEELLGTDASKLLAPDELGLIEPGLGELPGAVNTLVVRGRHRSGEDRWLEVAITSVVDATSKRPIGWSGTARRLTEAKHPRIVREIYRRSTTDMMRNAQPTIAFQPIVDIRSGVVIGVESLSRFPSRPGVSPDVVFAEAAYAGLGADLELLAVRRALEEAKLLDGSLYVAVNVSPGVLESAALVDALVASGLDLRRIVVEITEHASVLDYTVLERPRQRLRDLGVRLAVDDAGSGYASLRHILTLVPDIIKLDRELVMDLSCDRARRALVAAVVSFATEIGATTVTGEGVETQAELEALAALGVDAAQGYHIGRPTTSPHEWSYWGGPARRSSSSR